MIKSITVTNHRGESLRLILTRPELSGFAVLSAEGFGPPKGVINTTDIVTGDGGMFNSARTSQRNITLDLLFISSKTESIEAVRHKSYKFFPIKKKIRLQVETDTRTTFVDGYVETNEPTIFSSNEGCQISIICPYPYFTSAKKDNVTTFSSVEPMFEFPFSNESTTSKLIEMGDISVGNTRVVYNEGDADVGMTVKMVALGTVKNITIHHLDTRESMRIDTDKIATYTGNSFGEGDEITITTGVNNKSVSLFRDGKSTNILNCLDRDADWIVLKSGDNAIAYVAESGQDLLQVRIENKVLYDGV